jgi:hypothetical protein
MKTVIWIFPFLFMSLAGCATRTRSLILGGAGGVAIGGYTGSAVYSGPEKQIQTRNTLLGAGIGLGVGLLTSYLLHDHVEERMSSQRYEQDERLRFGDLPPNPFNPANQRFLEAPKSKEGQ